MSRPYYSVKHVPTMSRLPSHLTRGRAYFVEDEQVIIIDHGLGPVIYGGKLGPQGVPGEPVPAIQAQIDSLAEASLRMQSFQWQESEYVRSQDKRIETGLEDTRAHLQSQVDQTAEAILTLASLLNEKFSQYDSAVSILAKTISEMYPDSFRPKGDEENADPLDNEVISTDAGSWKIQQTVLKDGMIELVLEAQELLIDTLKAGDTVEYDGASWGVTEIQKQDGFIILTLDNY